MQIGVIADTHSKMRPEALDVLKGSDLILHVGDVGRDEVLEGACKPNCVTAHD